MISYNPGQSCFVSALFQSYDDQKDHYRLCSWGWTSNWTPHVTCIYGDLPDDVNVITLVAALSLYRAAPRYIPAALSESWAE